MKLHGHDIGVCSWSLRPSDLVDLFARVRRLNLSHVQLALADLVAADAPQREAAIKAVHNSGLTVTATMISFAGEDYTTIASIRRTGGYAPDEQWESRKSDTIAAARLAKDMGADLLSAHVGFVPMSSDPQYRVMVDRVGEIAAALAPLGVTFLMETGQETASELLQFLNDLRTRNVAVNFDPANMILYGAGDPIEAIATIGRHIRHVHVKDAIGSDHPGTQWGEEVPFGKGQVPPKEFIDALLKADYRGPLVIEREAGDDRMADVRFAIETLSRL
jgi:sugar phosphate isomerase/epimerase